MAEEKAYDLVIIGAGPGGYVAAVRAAQLGMKTACVEKEPRLGGICLNYGCIPSKALLDSSRYYAMAGGAFSDHGIRVGDLKLDISRMMARKEEVVAGLTENVRKLLEGNNIRIIHGTAGFSGKNQVQVKHLSGEDQGRAESLEPRNVLLATGSRPISLPGVEFDGDRVVTSTEALAFDAVPETLVVVGGGYIGLELGSVWARLGSRVTVLEMQESIAGPVDGQIARTLLRSLKKQGLSIELKTRVLGAEVKEDGVSVSIEKEGGQESLSAERVLVAVGRSPLTDGLGLDAAGVELDENGRVRVDESFQTTASGVYAIGDLIAGPMLAHKASAEGRAAVECMAGKAGEVNYGAIPAVIYTHPEAAYVGLTEEQLKERRVPYCKGTYPFTGAGRARCMGDTEGFVKVLSHTETDRILGVHILGPRASDMIPEAVLAMETGASCEDVGRVVHGHPTFSEAFQEAAMVAQECSIYIS
jgi:dihydrolipoamide dehydrogenase